MKRFLHRSFLLSALLTLSIVFIGSKPIEGEGNPNVNRRIVLQKNIRLQSNLKVWYNSLTGAKPSRTLLRDLNNLMWGLENAGILSELDLFHPIGGLETDEQRLKPIISTSGNDFTNVNSVTLNSNGATGNGSSSYLNLNWNPNTDGVKYVLNNAHIACYSRTDVAENSTDISAYNGTTQFTGFNIKWGDGNWYCNIHKTSSSMTYANANSLGFYIGQRTASTAQESFKNGVSIASNTLASVGIPNYDVYACGRNNAGTADSFSTRNLALFSAGSSLDNLELTYYNLIQTYMTARGINV